MRAAFKRIFLCVMIGGVLALVGFATYMTYRYGVAIYKAYVLSDTWSSTTGNIASARSIKGCGKGGRDYSLDVTYNYTVGGTEFTSNKIWFGNGYCSGRSDVDLMATKFLIGAQTFVYFNPKTPSESVLVRGRVENDTLILFLLMLCMPLGAMALLIKSVIEARQQPSIRVEIRKRSDGK